MSEKLEPDFDPVVWHEDRIRFLDQALLPRAERWIETADYRDIVDAIRRLAIRGAPLIGIAAAYGLALAARTPGSFQDAARELGEARPTAVNLRWAVRRVVEASNGHPLRA